jgi:multimeric flavodoxin WrbA
MSNRTTTEAPSTAPSTGRDAEAAGDGRSFLFVLGSSRPDGNTETLARAAAAQLPAHVPQRWVDLTRLPLPDFQDGRHDTDSWIAGENEETLREATLAATDIVIASPLYWYSLSAQTKRYLDYWSGWLTAPGSGFKEGMAGGRLWGVTVMADDDERVADGLVTALHHSAAYLRMGFGGVLFGNGSRPGQVRDDEQALIRAKTFFERQAPLARFPHDDGARAVTETG